MEHTFAVITALRVACASIGDGTSRSRFARPDADLAFPFPRESWNAGAMM
jgi:hypothetical protein